MDLGKKIRIDKLKISKYHTWKPEIELVLANRERDHVVEQNYFFSQTKDPAQHKKWESCDRQARAIIRLSLSHDILENIKDPRTSKHILSHIKSISRLRTLFNKVHVRRDFHEVEMKAGERLLSYIHMPKELRSILKSVITLFNNLETFMAVLGGLLSSYDSIVTTLNAFSGKCTVITSDLVESHLFKEEERQQKNTQTQQ